MPHRSARSAHAHKQPSRLHLERKGKLVSFTIRPWAVAFMSLTFIALLGWSAATTAYVLFRDELLVGLFNRYTEMQYAYEDKVATLRTRLDRVASRQLIDQEAFEAKLAEVVTKQSKIESRHASVAAFMAEVNGTKPVITPKNTSDASGVWGSRNRTIGRLLEDTELSLANVEKSQVDALATVEKLARRDTDRVRRALADLGLESKISLAPPVDTTGSLPAAQGGPYLPIARQLDEGKDPFKEMIDRARHSMLQAERATKIVNSVPVRRPMLGTLEISSGFGPRVDPFMRAMAQHSGLDFRGETGTPVYATARGKVSEAGWNGGYGNLVEIEHGFGLSTRYGHLSSITVEMGQTVEIGQMVGRIGSTGRSTGPHLHYETRIDGDATDPMRFLHVGARLSKTQ
jgi:murein DD-endopeptidase MepM/ murein hydrolase activator NlpD